MGSGMGGYGGGDDTWDGCCEVKNVWGSWNPAMDGVYVLVGKRWDIPSVCSSPCVYVKMDQNGAGMGGMGGMGGVGGYGGNGGMGGMGGSNMGGSGMGGMGGYGGMGGGMGGMGGYGGGKQAQYCFKPSQFTKAECDAFPDLGGYGSGNGQSG